MDPMLENWIEKNNVFSIRNGSWHFYLTGHGDASAFRNAMPGMDRLLLDGKMLKHSKTTTAAVRRIPGCPGIVFLKRTNNKGLRFTFRYLFRRARSFRAARATILLQENGVPTPGLYAFGERRTLGMFLDAGYLLTEAFEDAVDVQTFFVRAEDPETALKRILSEAVPLIARIHGLGMIHRDCKLSNLYFRENGAGPCGVWDLDGARMTHLPLSDRQRLVDLARLAASFITVSGMRTDGFRPELPALCRSILSHYSGDSVRISTVAMEAAVHKFFL